IASNVGSGFNSTSVPAGVMMPRWSGRPRCRPDSLLGDRAYDAEYTRYASRARQILPLLGMIVAECPKPTVCPAGLEYKSTPEYIFGMPPAILLRLEGAALFFCGIFFYHSLGAGWILFVTLCLWPDVSMLGYLVNPKLGSRLYNLVHTEVLPAALAASSFALHRTSLLAFALIWLCHIGFDRLIGAGLKYPTFFKDTHLQRV